MATTTARLPRFALGARVRGPHDAVGVVDSVYVDLDAAIDSGVVDGKWLKAQQPAPKTKPKGHWYGVSCDDDEGQVLVGELDLQLEDAKTTKKKAAAKKTATKKKKKKKKKKAAR